MYVWQHSIADEFGRILPNAHVYVRDAATLALVSIYRDEDGDDELDNPFPARGAFARFYAAAGRYQITAVNDSLERVYEDVVLGITTAELPPSITVLIRNIVEVQAAAAVAGFSVAEGFTCVGVGSVGSDGSALNLPAGWSSSFDGLTYQVVHNHGADANDYFVWFTPTGIGGHVNAQAHLYASGFFQYRCFNDENSNIAAPVRFALFTNEPIIPEA